MFRKRGSLGYENIDDLVAKIITSLKTEPDKWKEPPDIPCVPWVHRDNQLKLWILPTHFNIESPIAIPYTLVAQDDHDEVVRLCGEIAARRLGEKLIQNAQEQVLHKYTTVAVEEQPPSDL